MNAQIETLPKSGSFINPTTNSNAGSLIIPLSAMQNDGTHEAEKKAEGSIISNPTQNAQINSSTSICIFKNKNIYKDPPILEDIENDPSKMVMEAWRTESLSRGVDFIQQMAAGIYKIHNYFHR